MQQFLVGLDVGSTTVKAIVVDAATDKTIWQDYQRHETRQPEKVSSFCAAWKPTPAYRRENTRIFITGSGGGTIAEMVGAKFVQEVHAVSLAVEKLHPEVYSVIELGGQDAKIIVFKDDEETGRKKKIPSMNDKCAGGTGAVIDKINAKLKIPAAELANQGYHGVKLHKVAGKCGVFAETDINGLQKTGTPSARADGVALRSHRPAESECADPRTYTASACSAPGRPKRIHPRHARGMAGQHPSHVEGAQGRNSGGHRSRRS